jgi:hypothetical protein
MTGFRITRSSATAMATEMVLDFERLDRRRARASRAYGRGDRLPGTFRVFVSAKGEGKGPRAPAGQQSATDGRGQSPSAGRGWFRAIRLPSHPLPGWKCASEETDHPSTKRLIGKHDLNEVNR